MKYGLDFGTTNSAIAIEENGTGKVLPVDASASDPRVVRTVLYFNRRELVYKENISTVRIKNNTLWRMTFIMKVSFIRWWVRLRSRDTWKKINIAMLELSEQFLLAELS